MKNDEFYNDLALSFDQCWSLLETGATNRKSAFHTPALCTLSADGSPQSRILVLRDVDKNQRLLRFNSDMRSPKIAEITTDPRAAVLSYDPETRVQLRLTGHMRVKNEGADVDAIWAASDRYARRCYMTQSAPSSNSDVPTSGLPQSVEGRKPEEAELAPARANFTLLLFEAQHIDWLYLATEGHRRAQWCWNGDDWQGTWLIP
jgi:pyridoxamine 5'-phosphate oxidase